MRIHFVNRLASIFSRKVPLRTVLITPFVVLIVIAVGLTGYLSYRNGRQAVNDVAAQLRTEIITQIGHRLETFLETPHLINQNNANALRLGLLAANDSAALERYFWEQIQVFDTVTSIYFGNTQGGLVDAGREGAEGFLYVIMTDGFTNGPFRKYATDDQGNRGELLTTVPDFDARTRPWYSSAVETGQAAWSDIYILFTGQDMAIAASHPVYDPTGELLGVVSSDLFLSHISNFLQNLAIGKTGEAFIVEHSGLLVASSTGEPLFSAAADDQPQRRLYAADNNTPLIRDSVDHLIEQFGSLETIESSRQFEFDIDGDRYFAQVAPFHKEQGLDWLIVVVIPEADFMAQINTNAHTTLWLILAALGLAMVAGIFTARWVTQPLLDLNQATQSLAEGQWTQAITTGRIREIGQLTQSFNTMAHQLTQTLGRLTAEIVERERTEQELREREHFLALLNGITYAALETLNFQEMLQLLADRLAELIEADGCYLTLWDEASQTVRPAAAYGHLRQTYPWVQVEPGEVTMTESVLQAGHILVAEDVFNTPYISARIAALFPARSLLGLPLVAGGRKLGAALIAFNQPHHFTSREIALCEQTAPQISLAIANASALEALRQSETRYRAIVEDQTEFVCRSTPDHTLTFVNQAYCRFFGHSRQELIGQNLMQFVPPESKQAVLDKQAGLTPDKPVASDEHQERRADGSLRWLNWTDRGIFDETTGQLVEIQAVGRDVTNRVEAEAKLRQLSRAVEQSGNTIVITDLEANIEYVNPAFTQITGYTSEEAIGQNPRILQSGLTRPELYNDLWATVTTGKVWNGEFINKKKNGELYWASAVVSPVKNEAGEITHYVAVKEDITHRKQAEQALQEGHQNLEAALTELKETQEKMVQQERLAAVGQLAAGIAHDFNNILTSILGYAELLRVSPDISQSVEADLARIVNSGQRAAHLVRQLLDFSRKSIHQPQQLDPVPLIKEAVKFLERTIPENIRIHLEIVPAAHLIEADPTQIQQLLTNLTVNASDAMSSGGTLNIKVSQKELEGEKTCVICSQTIEGQWECIEVIDTGSGILPDVLPHIFEPFFTTKEVGDGTGLGLAQVYGIVTQHEGHITVNSRIGRGTTFGVYLPPITPGQK